MLIVCTCENNSFVSQKYSEMLLNISQKHNIEMFLESYRSGEELLHEVKDYLVDIVYMDIYLDGMNGIETARQLQSNGYQPSIIFLTNSRKHVYEAFDVSPVNYLIKEETTDEEFERVFLKTVGLAAQRKKELLLCKTRNLNIAIPIKEITYITISKRLITVHYNETKTQFYGCLENLEKQLQNMNFLRIHRSYIVNLLRVITYGPHQVVLKNGVEIPIGTTYVSKLQEAVVSLYFDADKHTDKLLPGKEKFFCFGRFK